MRTIHGNAGDSTDTGKNDIDSRLKNGVKKLTLDAPVHLGTLVETQSSNQNVESIWLNKQDDSLKTVDSKKLEKAEAQLQKKLEKKDTTPTPVKYKSSEATASQVISRKDANDDL